MPYAQYKQGVPNATAVPNYATGFTASAATPPSAVATNNVYGLPTPPNLTGSASRGTQNSNNGTTVTGAKLAGSLNSNGVLTVAPGRNTPRS